MEGHKRINKKLANIKYIGWQLTYIYLNIIRGLHCMLNITPYSRTSTISNNEQIPSSTRNMRSIECDLNSCNKEVSSEAIDRLFDRALNGTEPDRKIAENLIFDIFSSEKKPKT